MDGVTCRWRDVDRVSRGSFCHQVLQPGDRVDVILRICAEISQFTVELREGVLEGDPQVSFALEHDCSTLIQSIRDLVQGVIQSCLALQGADLAILPGPDEGSPDHEGSQDHSEDR